jgi:uncharacterized membrane protein YqhA
MNAVLGLAVGMLLVMAGHGIYSVFIKKETR